MASEKIGKVAAMNILARIRRIPFWSWFWFGLGTLYFLLPLYATVNFSLRMERDAVRGDGHGWPPYRQGAGGEDGRQVRETRGYLLVV